MIDFLVDCIAHGLMMVGVFLISSSIASMIATKEEKEKYEWGVNPYFFITFFIILTVVANAIM